MEDPVAAPAAVLDPVADLRAGLDTDQRAAVLAEPGPLLVVAGAGSGKTRVLTRRAACAVKLWRYDPSQVLAISFTNKAVDEMRERLRSLVGHDGAAVIGCMTFHAAAWRLVVRPYGMELPQPRGAIYDNEESLRVIRRAIKDTALAKTPGASEIFSRISWAKAHGLTPPQLERLGDLDATVAGVWRRYRAELAGCYALDFEDLMAAAVWILEQRPEVLREVGDRFRAIVVDEYQDASPVQARFLELLAGEHANLTVVGDPDQAVYRFRGGDATGMGEFEQRWPGAQRLVLPNNYRSRKAIVKTASQLIIRNSNRLGKHTKPMRQGGTVRLWVAEDEDAEAAGIFASLQGRLDRGRAPDEIAVLCRSSWQLARLEEQHLAGSQIPYVFAGRWRFLEHAEIKDLLAYIKLQVDPHHREAFERVIGHIGGVGTGSLARLVVQARAERVSPVERALDGAPIDGVTAARRDGLREAAEAISVVGSELGAEGLEAAVRMAAEVSGWRERVDRAEDEIEAARRSRRIASLGELAAEHDREPGDDDLEAFLGRLALEDTEQRHAPGEAVTLSTIHGAKGREWPLVCVVSACEGRLPSWRAERQAELEEERRVAYVAMTRAQDELVLTAPARCRVEGEVKDVPLSRFVYEAGLGS